MTGVPVSGIRSDEPAHFQVVMGAARELGWPVWIAPSSSRSYGGYVVHTKGPVSGRQHRRTIPDAVVTARYYMDGRPR